MRLLQAVLLIWLTGCIVGPDGRRYLDPNFARAMSEGSRRSQEDFQRMNQESRDRFQRQSDDYYRRQQDDADARRRMQDALKNGSWQPDPWNGGFKFVPNPYAPY
jgi:hypothetical protein